jgi:gas vesicle protein
MKMSTIVVSALFVGAAGVIAGALLAPGKGEKPKSKFGRKGQEYKAYLQDNFDEFADFVSHPFENVEDETKRLGKKANARAKKIKAKVKQKLN